MAISYGEEVCPSVLSKVGKHQEAVLINLVRILWGVARFCCEGEFGDAVVKLFIGLSWLNSVLMVGAGVDLFTDTRPNIDILLEWRSRTILLLSLR